MCACVRNVIIIYTLLCAMISIKIKHFTKTFCSCMLVPGMNVFLNFKCYNNNCNLICENLT